MARGVSEGGGIGRRVGHLLIHLAESLDLETREIHPAMLAMLLGLLGLSGQGYVLSPSRQKSQNARSQTRV